MKLHMLYVEYSVSCDCIKCKVKSVARFTKSLKILIQLGFLSC